MRLPAAKQWTEIPFHPFVFAVFPILSLYATNLAKGYLGEAIVIAAGLLVLVAVVWLLVNLLVKQASASAIILSAFLVLFFSLGHVISALSSILERLGLSDQTQFLVKGETSLIIWLTIWGILLLCIALYATRKARELHTLTRYLNVVALALLVVGGLNLGINGVKTFVIPRLRAEMDRSVAQADGQDHENSTTTEPDASPSAADVETGEDISGVRGFINSWRQNRSPNGITISGSSPDIYYIIVDAYARQDILQELFGFDNSDFINYLIDKGFYVASASTANYPQTALSLASTLNMMYLDDVIGQIGAHTNDRFPLEVMIKESKVFDLLRNGGYKLIAFDSGYGPTRFTNADVYLSPPKWSPSAFQEAFIMLTPLSGFRRTVADFRRQRTLYAFDQLTDAAEMEGASFTFAHITTPHFPFIFDADGHPIEPGKGTGRREDYEYDEYIEGYTNQLIFTSNKLISAIDAILALSPEPPIIIIQSDHGPAAQLDPSWSVSDSNVSERLSILNAYLFPDQDYASLYEGISPVNTFRVILNEYFGTDYDLLDDRSFFSSWSRPYDLTEVTTELTREE